MSDFTEKMYWILNKAIVLVSALILAFLIYYSAGYSHMFAEDYIEWESIKTDNIFIHALFMVLLLAVLTVFIKISAYGKRKVVLGLILESLIIFFSVLYVFDGSVYQPSGDQYYLCECAREFINGQYDSLIEGGYLSQYPYQIGITFFFEIVARLAEDNLYFTLICINLSAVILLSIVGYMVCREVFDENVSNLFLFLMMLQLPIYFYISFVYGESLSLLFSMIHIWQMLIYVKKGKKSALCLMWLSALAAVLFRANSIIVVIAVAITLFIKSIKEKKAALLIAGMLSFVVVFAGRAAIECQYELRSGYHISEGIPPSTWIAMGMQEGIRGNGWYSEYSVELYEMCEYDSNKTDEAASSYIKDRIKEFWENPGVFWEFYREKILSQWDEPSMESLLVLNAGLDKSAISNMKREILYGKYYHVFLAIMNEFQTFIYCMAFVGAVYLMIKEKQGEAYLFHLVFLGGFLFQILWEAKSRYVFFYMVLLLPICAKGIYILIKPFIKKSSKSMHKMKYEEEMI